MKTAISLPDDLFDAIDARARALRISRSALLAKLAREYLDRDPTEDPTEAWNQVADAQTDEEERALTAFQRASAAVIRRGEASWEPGKKEPSKRPSKKRSKKRRQR